MRIFYVSTLCSDKTLNNLLENGCKIALQAQVYHKICTAGLTANPNVKVDAISSIPVTPYTNKKKLWGFHWETKDDVLSYNYMPFVNLPVLRQISLFFSTFFYVFISIIGKKEIEQKIVISDILNISIAAAAMLAAKICGGKSIAIITDVPIFMYKMAKPKKMIKRIMQRINASICTFIMGRYDMYLLLTKQMNNVVNKKNKPFVVIEGFVDEKMKYIDNKIENKEPAKVIMYAGGVDKVNGIDRLVKAFMMQKDNDLQLWIYGAGELSEMVMECEAHDSRVRYFGVVPNNIVLEAECSATLLVNPRPSNEEFTKYSFPSKNMEYMASGTPVLTTKLPGMPEEYYDYVYLFEDESVEGMAKTLDRILKLPKEELHAKGAAAKEFVLREKNNIVQTKRIIDMIRETGRK